MAVETAPTYLNLTVTSSLTAFGAEKRFQSSTNIGELKGKLELITGSTASLMQLQLLDGDGKLICEMDNDSAVLGSYPVENGYRIHVIDHDPIRKKGEFEDVSQVEKFELSAEAYAQRTDSVQAFKRRMKLGQFAGKDPQVAADAEAEERERERQEAEAIPVGSRCEVSLPEYAPRKGTVMFVGKTHFKPGIWVGVKYDEPLGKNNGSVGGKSYFECPPKFGAFIRPKSVKVGDFPEDTYSDDEM